MHLSEPIFLVLLLLLFLAAILYSSVGHGGASAYLAIFGLLGMLPIEMKPNALVLNIGVSLLAMIAFTRAGHFRAKLFWPLALASMPAAFIGGWLQLPDPIFKIILAIALLLAAWRLLFKNMTHDAELKSPNQIIIIGIGMLIGFISGLIGIGGGIFLTPLIIFFRWSHSKTAAAISAAFIFVNSISGLTGFVTQGGNIPPQVIYLLPAALIGGWLGANWGSNRAPNATLQRVLAVVLIIAAAKFLII